VVLGALSQADAVLRAVRDLRRCDGWHRELQQARAARWDEIERLWQTGLPMAEIARLTGYASRVSLNAQVVAMRRAGRNVPYRRVPGGRGRVTA
jgi:hypothetical protein